MIFLFIFLIGLAVGSFLNVVIDRLPRGQTISGRSHCDFCHKKLAWYDLMPIFSFILLGGKCRYCDEKLSWQYPLVELLTAGVFLATWMYWPAQQLYILIAHLVVVACLIAIFFSDLKYRVISEWVLLVLFIFSLLNNPLASFHIGTLLLAGLIVMLPIFILYALTRGRGMGFGDVELAFIMGVLLGLKGGLIALYISFILGGVVGGILLATGKKKLKSHVAFGPFLVVGTFMILFFSQVIFHVFANFLPF